MEEKIRFARLSVPMLTTKRVVEINALLKQLSKRAKNLSKNDLVRKLRKPIFWLIALDGKKTVGMATICFREPPVDKIGTIEGVIVDQIYQGRGIGKILNKMLIEEAKKRKSDHIELTSKPKRKSANALYKKLGFKKPKTNYLRLYL